MIILIKMNNTIINSYIHITMKNWVNIVLRHHLPSNDVNNADLPAFLGPKTKHRKTFRSVCCFFLSSNLLLVMCRADAALQLWPMYIKLAIV